MPIRRVSRTGRFATHAPPEAEPEEDAPVRAPVPVAVPDIAPEGVSDKVFNPVSRKFVKRGGIVHKRLISAGVLPPDPSLAARKKNPPMVKEAWEAWKREKARDARLAQTQERRGRTEAKRDEWSDTEASTAVSETDDGSEPQTASYDDDLVRAVAKKYATDLSDMSETEGVELRARGFQTMNTFDIFLIRLGRSKKLW